MTTTPQMKNQTSQYGSYLIFAVLVHCFVNNYTNRAGCGFACVDGKNADVSDYAETFSSVQSDLQAIERYSYFISINDVSVYCIIVFQVKTQGNISVCKEEGCVATGYGD